MKLIISLVTFLSVHVAFAQKSNFFCNCQNEQHETVISKLSDSLIVSDYTLKDIETDSCQESRYTIDNLNNTLSRSKIPQNVCHFGIAVEKDSAIFIINFFEINPKLSKKISNDLLKKSSSTLTIPQLTYFRLVQNKHYLIIITSVSKDSKLEIMALSELIQRII